MLLHLPRMAERGRLRVKNGPALAGHGAEAVRDAITSTIATLPVQLRRSLTWDQGAEMAQHAQLRIDTGLHVFFCDPRSPWQRGTNENTNGLLRQYFPKGTDLNRHSASDIAAVAATLNRRQRKTLDWRTPSEAFNELLLSHSEDVLRRPLETGQYTSYAFGKRCRDAGVMPSMGSIGDAYDNAMAESFFATLEREVLNRRRFRSQAEARMAIFQWLEGWYNPHRRHSALGYRSPINYERRQLPQSA